MKVLQLMDLLDDIYMSYEGPQRLKQFATVKIRDSKILVCDINNKIIGEVLLRGYKEEEQPEKKSACNS